MDAKQLRLAKWKQAKQAKQAAQDAPKDAAAAAQVTTPPQSTPPSSLKLSLANLRHKRHKSRRVTFDEGLIEDANAESRSHQSLKPPDSGKTTTFEAPTGALESVDDALSSLDSSSAAFGSAYVSEDSDSNSDETLLTPRKRPKSNSSKLDTVVADHSSEMFEKRLFHPQLSNIVVDTEAFRLANGIKVDGADLSPLANWYSAGLPLPLLKAIEARGFASPTPIQAQSLPIIMSGSDLVGIAPTSSGKTIAFLLPLCRHVAANQAQHKKMSKGPYALVLAPTRELCLQIFREVEPLAKSLQLNALGCYGGTDISNQISELINGRCDIIVATPGRLIDLLATNHGRVLTLRGVTFLVVDETDRMFDLGFGPQVRTIVGAIRPDRQTVVFSATMSAGMESLVSRILTDPARVTIGRQATVPPQITQEVVLVDGRQDKLPILLRALDSVKEHGLTLVFVETQDKADAITLQLMAKGFKCQALHGGMDQRDRAATIAEFRGGTLPVLVATSIAARGLDVRSVKLVVNFDAASHLEDYVHRAGRTGRGGDSGRCLTLLEASQTRHAHELSRLFSVPDNVQRLANEYAQSSNKAEQSRLGFGGHGLANLEKKRDLKKTVEHDAYAPRQESREPDAKTTEEGRGMGPNQMPAVFQEGGSFAARLPINDLSKEARVAATAAGNQTRVSNDCSVSVTIRGTFFSRPKKDAKEDEKLHLYIEGKTQHSVSSALDALTELVEGANAKQGGRYMVL